MTFGQWFLMQQMAGEGGGGGIGGGGSPTPPPSYFGGAQFDPNQNQGWSEPTPIPNMPGYMPPGDPNLQTGPNYFGPAVSQSDYQVQQLGIEPASLGDPEGSDMEFSGGQLASDSPTFSSGTAFDPSAYGDISAPSTLGGDTGTLAQGDPGVLSGGSGQYPDGQGGYAPINLGDLPESNLSDRPPGYYQNPFGSYGVGGEGGTLANEPNIGAGPQPGSLYGLGSFGGGNLGQYGRVVGRNTWDAKIPLTAQNYNNLTGYLNYNLGGFIGNAQKPQWVWDASQNRFVKRTPQGGQGQQGGMTYAQYLQEWNALRQAGATGGTQGGGEPGGGATSNVQGGGRPQTSTQ